MIAENSKIYIAGHRGMVGSAVWRALESKGYSNLIGKTSAELDLRNQQSVSDFYNEEHPEVVIDAAAKEAGIHVPIIPGIKPIAVKRHLQLLPQVFRIDLPESLISAVESCKTNKDVRQVGVEWAIQQSKELLAAGVPVLHYYSMGKSDNIKAIASAVF